MSLHCAAETYIKIKVPGADGAEGKAMSFMYFLAVLIGPLAVSYTHLTLPTNSRV